MNKFLLILIYLTKTVTCDFFLVQVFLCAAYRIDEIIFNRIGLLSAFQLI